MALDGLAVSAVSMTICIKLVAFIIRALLYFVILNWNSSCRSWVIKIHLRLEYLPSVGFIPCPETISLLDVLLLTMRRQEHRLGIQVVKAVDCWSFGSKDILGWVCSRIWLQRATLNSLMTNIGVTCVLTLIKKVLHIMNCHGSFTTRASSETWGISGLNLSTVIVSCRSHDHTIISSTLKDTVRSATLLRL